MLNEQQILDIISQTTGISEHDLKSSPKGSLPWDSFTHVELIITLEEALGTHFAEATLKQMVDLESVLHTVSSLSAVQ